MQSWLEQDASCPTCRCSLSIHSYSNQSARANDIRIDDQDAPQRTGTNHFFQFNGSRYVSWLPNFSVEVTNINDILMRETMQQQQQNHTSQARNMARQVQEMFPHIPLPLIITDLQSSHSIEATIDNILEGRLQVPSRFQENIIEPDVDAPSSSQAGTSGSYLARSASDYYVSPNLEYSPASNSSSSGESSPTPSTSSGYEVERSNSIFGNHNDLLREESVEDVSVTSRFSQSSEERERILQKRKDQLLVNARKRYLERSNGDGSASSSNFSSSDSILRHRNTTLLD